MGRAGRTGRSSSSPREATPDRAEQDLPSFRRDISLDREKVRRCPASPEKRVMIDIDNTLFPLMEALKAMDPRLRNLELSPGYRDLRIELARAGFDPDQLIQELYHNSEAMENVGAFRQAREVVEKIRDHGIAVHIVSSRPESSRPATERFLESAGITFDTISFGVEDKLEYLEREEITTLVDDNPDLIQSAEARGKDAISFDWEHTKSALRENGGQEASDWQEIGHHILDAVETNIGRRQMRESEDPRSIEMQAHDMNMMIEASMAGHDATCLRRRVGAVIVSTDGDIIHRGSNQSPEGAPSCEEDGCLTDASGRCQRTVHAEASAILSATPGSLAGSTLYCTDRPCLGCAKLIAASGVRRVVYARPYHAESLEVDALFEASGVEVSEIASAHEDLPLPPGGPREGARKPDDQKIVQQI